MSRAHQIGCLWVMFALLILLMLAGCSSTCKDRVVHSSLLSTSTYYACGHCCVPNEAGERCICRCSLSCPCWKSH